MQGLREHGYVPGANADVVMRFADGRPERLPVLADELVRLGVDVLVAGSTIGGIGAKHATATIPIVFAGSSDPVAAARREALVAFAGAKRLPAMSFSEDFVEAGVLTSYGPSYADAYRRAASYVDRILKGARPGDLAVEQPTAFDLVVNARTARAIGLAMPRTILLRASRVIG